MESVGRLAGGVAHDFNNMMGIVVGYTELALERVDPSQAVYANLVEILNAGNRAADLTRQLLAFARKQTIIPKVMDLNNTLENMLSMLKRVVGEDVQLKWSPGEKIWRVKMDPSQVDQILANLCVNARDAITGVGQITIETQNATFDEEYCSENPEFQPGQYVQLTVSDNGHGIEKEILDKIFEPFFTTKELGKGTGLGLSTIYGIVQQNSGFINLTSEVGSGTTFRIYIPRYRGEHAGASENNTGDLSIGQECVLLVEDEPSFLKLCKSMLEKLGYQVLSANSPKQAIEIVQNHAGEFDLLITDLIMPEMTGRELSDKLQTIKPGFKRLFMSGYTADIIDTQNIQDDNLCFIQKPFSFKELSLKVREALEKF